MNKQKKLTKIKNRFRITVHSKEGTSLFRVRYALMIGKKEKAQRKGMEDAELNVKEIREIRRRLRHEHNCVTRIYGCYVNSEKNIIAHLEESVGLLKTEESMKYFDIFKKTLGGKPGKTLLDLEFSRTQESGDAYQLLLSLWEDRLANVKERDQLCRAIIDQLSMEGNYVILMMLDDYDVKTLDEEDTEGFKSTDTFTYMICAVCPVKNGKAELGYMDDEKRFLDASINQMIDQPSLGFLFPSFNDRSTDIHHALVFSHKTDENYEPFITAVFGSSSEIPLTGEEQKVKFDSILANTLKKECTFEVVQTMHEALAERVACHKEAKIPDPLAVMPEELGNILRNAGAGRDAVDDFEEEVGSLVIEGAESSGIQVNNITDEAKMVIETEGVKIIVKPEMFAAVEAKESASGSKEIVIRINGGCKINGVEVNF